MKVAPELERNQPDHFQAIRRYRLDDQKQAARSADVDLDCGRAVRHELELATAKSTET